MILHRIHILLERITTQVCQVLIIADLIYLIYDINPNIYRLNIKYI